MGIFFLYIFKGNVNCYNVHITKTFSWNVLKKIFFCWISCDFTWLSPLHSLWSIGPLHLHIYKHKLQVIFLLIRKVYQLQSSNTKRPQGTMYQSASTPTTAWETTCKFCWDNLGSILKTMQYYSKSYSPLTILENILKLKDVRTDILKGVIWY